MLDWSIEQNEHPVLIRIPRGKVIHTSEQVSRNYSDLNKSLVVREGTKIAILALGDFFPIGEDLHKAIYTELGIEATLINPRYASGIDTVLLDELKKEHSLVITLEDSMLDGGYGQKVASFYGCSNMKVINYGLAKEFLDGYNANQVLEKYGMTLSQELNDIRSVLV